MDSDVSPAGVDAWIKAWRLDALQRTEFFYRRARRLRQGMIFATLAIAVLRVAFPDAFDSLIEKTLTMPTALSLYFSVAVFTVALEW